MQHESNIAVNKAVDVTVLPYNETNITTCVITMCNEQKWKQMPKGKSVMVY